MKKLVGPLTLSLAFSSCHIENRYTMADLLREGVNWNAQCRNLSSPERFKPFNPILEELSGGHALDASRVEIIDGKKQRQHCYSTFSPACYVGSRSKIYIDKDLERKLVEVGRKSWQRVPDPHRIEGSQIITTYVHEQGHHIDKRLSPTPDGAAFDELEAMVLAVYFSQVFAERYERLRGTDFFYSEIEANYSRIVSTLEKIGDFRSYRQLLSNYDSDVLGTANGDNYVMLKEGMPHNIGSIVFAILIKGFDYDAGKLYRFIHAHSHKEVEESADAALQAMGDTKRAIKSNFKEFRKTSENRLPPREGFECDEPSTLSYNCSTANPLRATVVENHDSFQLYSEPDPWKVLKLFQSSDNIQEKISRTYSAAASDLEASILGSTWQFERHERLIYGRNNNLFAMMSVNPDGSVYGMEILHRSRDMKKLDLTLLGSGRIILKQNDIDFNPGYTKAIMFVVLPKNDFLSVSINVSTEDGDNVIGGQLYPPSLNTRDRGQAYKKFREIADLVFSLARPSFDAVRP